MIRNILKILFYLTTLPLRLIFFIFAGTILYICLFFAYLSEDITIDIVIDDMINFIKLTWRIK